MVGMRLYTLEMRIVIIEVIITVESDKPVYHRVTRRGASWYIYVRAGDGAWKQED